MQAIHKNLFSIDHLNVRSLVAHIEELEIIANKLQYLREAAESI